MPHSIAILSSAVNENGNETFSIGFKGWQAQSIDMT